MHGSHHNNTALVTLFVLDWKIDLRMYDAHVTGEGIATRKCLLLRTKVAAHLLLGIVVNCILVTSEVVGAGEDGVARLAGLWVDAVAAVRPCLAVA